MSRADTAPAGLAESGRCGAALYATVWTGALLLAAPYISWRALAHPAEMRERFGGWALTDEVPAGAIWVHAASLGEARAALPLLRALQSRGKPAFVSVITPAARASERELQSAGARFVRFAPLDFAPIVTSVFDRVRPAALLVLETEIWLGLLRAAALRNVPAAFVSARLTERGLQRSRCLRPLLRPALRRVAVAAQTGTDLARFQELGVPAERGAVAGNIKYSAERGPLPDNERTRLRNGWTRIITLGSVRSVEIDEIARMLAAAREWARDTLWIVAPRHPQRSLARLQRTLEPHGTVRMRTTRDEPLIPLPDVFAENRERAPVLIVTTFGELIRFYGVADAAFVGGTLGPIGGHNLFEAAEQAVPVAFGPHIANVADVAEALIVHHGGRQVADGAALARAFGEWTATPETARAAGLAALRAARHLGGAAARTLNLLSGWGYPVA